MKLAGGEKTATGKNSLKHTGDDKDKVEEFSGMDPTYWRSVENENSRQKKYKRRTKKQLQEIRKAKSKARRKNETGRNETQGYKTFAMHSKVETETPYYYANYFTN